MEYNVCEQCGADNGRAGLLFFTHRHPFHICDNCKSTLKENALVLKVHLPRKEHEIQLQSKLLEPVHKFRTINEFIAYTFGLKFKFLFIEGHRIQYYNKEKRAYISGELKNDLYLSDYEYLDTLLDLNFIQYGIYPG